MEKLTIFSFFHRSYHYCLSSKLSHFSPWPLLQQISSSTHSVTDSTKWLILKPPSYSLNGAILSLSHQHTLLLSHSVMFLCLHLLTLLHIRYSARYVDLWLAVALFVALADTLDDMLLVMLFARLIVVIFQLHKLPVCQGVQISLHAFVIF